MEVKLVGVTIATVCGVFAITAFSRNANVLVKHSEVLSAPRTFTGCTGECDEERCPGEGEHAAASGGLDKNAGMGAGWHQNCGGLLGCADHACSETSPAPEELLFDTRSLFARVGEAVIENNVEELQDLLESNPKRLHFASRRDAVQITACDGAIVAHYPVASRVALKLAN